ncbi:MAG TPA: Kazal-type serine protease inhibitor domain-containing protein [Rhizobiaceae bacterium]|nr:Kazal-type serine protease inhibitor domain-containing protein [Rhizobiaceae bacterium]
MKLRSMLGAGFAALILATGFLAACQVTVVEDRPIREDPPICTREYNPVCGERGPRQRTFANRCIAESEGYRVVHRGECRPVREEEFCTREYAPVCAERNGRLRTFGNECEARNAPGNWRIIARGTCERM